MTQNPEEESLLQFPCELTIKAMGLATEDFEATVVAIVNQHVSDLGEDAVRCRPSREGKYLSVSVRVYAQSRSQMDALYQDLSAHQQVLMAL
jgi:putative lipoic acid-binding regulatory protein